VTRRRLATLAFITGLLLVIATGIVTMGLAASYTGVLLAPAPGPSDREFIYT
jgi:hypothetical protein